MRGLQHLQAGYLVENVRLAQFKQVILFWKDAGEREGEGGREGGRKRERQRETEREREYMTPVTENRTKTKF